MSYENLESFANTDNLHEQGPTRPRYCSQSGALRR